jgi:hypothetical protein
MYRILCDRTPARELGSGLTWFKKDGQIVEFATTEEVGAMVKELTDARSAAKFKATATATVKYIAKEFNAE